MLITLTTLGVVIILALSLIAGKLVWQVRKNDKRATAEKERAEQNQKQQRDKMISSLHIIARAFLSGQVELGEASVRIHHLLNYLDVDDGQRESFVAFDKIAAAISHIPIKEEWKALSKTQRAEHRKTIERIEREFKDFALESANALTQFSLE